MTQNKVNHRARVDLLCIQSACLTFNVLAAASAEKASKLLELHSLSAVLISFPCRKLVLQGNFCMNFRCCAFVSAFNLLLET